MTRKHAEKKSAFPIFFKLSKNMLSHGQKYFVCLQFEAEGKFLARVCDTVDTFYTADQGPGPGMSLLPLAHSIECVGRILCS